MCQDYTAKYKNIFGEVCEATRLDMNQFMARVNGWVGGTVASENAEYLNMLLKYCSLTWLGMGNRMGRGNNTHVEFDI